MDCPNCGTGIYWIDDTLVEDEDGKFSHVSQYECHECGLLVDIYVPKEGS